MKIIEAHKVCNVVHFGYLGFRGFNPHIQECREREADFLWYSAWGDGPNLPIDLKWAAKKAAALNLPLLSVVMSDRACESDAAPYEKWHFSPAATEPARQIPYCEVFPDIYLDSPSRPILASFKGSTDTYLPRRELVHLSAPDVIIEVVPNFWCLPPDAGGAHQNRYRELMERSKYALCPKGQGASSVRLTEAIRFHCVPVMIDDETRLFGQPMDFAIRVTAQDLPGLVDRLRGISEAEYRERRAAMARFRETYLEQDRRAGCAFVFGSCRSTEYIRQTVENYGTSHCRPAVDSAAGVF